MIKADMHTHSSNSHDSKCPLFEMVQSQLQKGTCVMALTDHIDMEFCESIDNNKTAQGSHADVEKAREAFGDKIKILKGMEMGEAFWFPKQSCELLQSNPCDVVIGSVHAVRYKDLTMPYSLIDFSKLTESEHYEFLEQYFEDYKFMVQNTDFDIAAHLTCPNYYLNQKYKLGVDIHRFDGQMKEILQLIIKKDVSLEVNSHYINSSGVYMPDESILKLYYSMGGRKITTGSDAHVSEDASLGFDKLYDTLQNIGFENIYYYENRKAVSCPLKGEN